MKHTLVSLTLAIFFGYAAFAQDPQITTWMDNETMSSYLRGVYDTDLSSIEGTPFLNDEFLPGVVHFDGKALNAKVRYNVARENMQVQVKNESYILKYGMDVDILGKKYRQLNYQRDGKMYVGYFEVVPTVETPSLALLKKPLKKLKPGQAAGAMRPAKNPRYVDNEDYYLKFEDSSHAVPVERRIKNFIKVFPEEYQAQIRTLLKEKDLKPRKFEDLQVIVDYYNSL